MDESLLPPTKQTVGKPLKASNDVLPLDHPVIPYDRGIVVSTKIDGNRGMIVDHRMMTSSGKAPRNEHVHRRFANVVEICTRFGIMIDYEFFAPSLDHHAQLSGILNSIDQPLPDDLAMYVFDGCYVSQYLEQCIDTPYGERIEMYHDFVDAIGDDQVVALPQIRVANSDEATQLFNEYVDQGFEGAMLRTVDVWHDQGRLRGGYYKHGRATNHQQIIYKAKVYETIDGRITEVRPRRELNDGVERRHNEFGELVGTYPQDCYHDVAELGAFVVEYYDHKAMKIQTCLIGWGRGFNRPMRVELWNKRHDLIGRHLEFKYMPHGAKEGGGARHGRIVRFRKDLDG